jgi:uncharacterized protein YicC (UPF0701 family)
MREFIRFNYKNLRNEAHVEYHENADEVIVRNNPAALGILPAYNAYKALLDDEVSVLDVIRKSEYTDEIAEADHSRDEIYRGFAEAVKSALHHFDQHKKDAAKRLETVIKNYGNIAKKTLDQESAAIDDMLREINDHHEADVEMLAVADWLEQLELANENFKSLMSARYVETSQRPTTKMKNVRVEVDKAFATVLNVIDAFVALNGEENYAQLIDELNAVSERYKNLLAQAAGRKHKSLSL